MKSIRRFKRFIKRHIVNYKYKNIIKNKNEKIVFLLGTPEHTNLGDQAILEAEIEFLENTLPDFYILSIPERYINVFGKVLRQNIRPNDIVMYHGGGNFGDAWAVVNTFRNEFLTDYSKNKVISFPQSTAFNRHRTTNFYDTKTAIDSANITLIGRDRSSSQFMKENFDAEVLLVPDIVLSLSRQFNKKRNGIITMLREDHEKIDNNSIDLLVSQLSGKYNLKKSDTVINQQERINDSNRHRLLTEKLLEFSSSELVITDRLHGMIFAHITGTPAIVFDNNNHKVYNTYKDWLSDEEFIFFAQDKSNEQILHIAKKMIENTPNNDKINFDYSALKQAVLQSVDQ